MYLSHCCSPLLSHPLSHPSFRKGNEEAIWSVLKNLLPEWKLPETQEKEAQGEGDDKKDLLLGSVSFALLIFLFSKHPFISQALYFLSSLLLL